MASAVKKNFFKNCMKGPLLIHACRFEFEFIRIPISMAKPDIIPGVLGVWTW